MPLAVAEPFECREGELLIAAAFAAARFVDERDRRLAAGDQAIGPVLAPHPHGHFRQMPADIFRRAFGAIAEIIACE